MVRFPFQPGSMTLADGTRLGIRGVRPDDRNRLVDLFHRCSAETVYNRFLAPLSRLEGETLRRLVEIEPEREVGLVATVGGGTDERVVAVGRFRVVGDQPDTAELALVTEDAWQRRGIARELLRRMTAAARVGRVAWYQSTIDPSNLRVVRFLESCGHRGRIRYQDGLLRMWSEVAAMFPEHAPRPGPRA